jgi:hypothetical protein
LKVERNGEAALIWFETVLSAEDQTADGDAAEDDDE